MGALADASAGEAFLHKCYGEAAARRVVCTLASHPGKALVKVVDKSQDTYGSWPKSWYDLGDPKDALWVEFDHGDPCGTQILEFGKQSWQGAEYMASWYNYSDRHDDDCTIYGHVQHNDNYRYQWWQV